jgi:hypothetical protein
VNERIDEEIGALLDGRVPEPRRTELLTRLAADDADYDVFADTAAVLREAEEEGSTEKEFSDHREVVRETRVIPLRPRRASGWRSPAVRSLAAAAVLASTVLVPVLRTRMIANRSRDPERLAILSSPAGAALPADWHLASNATRGGTESVPNSGVAAVVGALQVALEVAARAAGPMDTAAVAQLARTAAATLESAEDTGPSLAAPVYRSIERLTDWSRPNVLSRIDTAHTVVVDYVDPDYFATGAWTEAARLAARRQNTAFFTAPESRRAVERTVGLPGLNDAAKKAASRVRVVTDQGKVQKWESLKEDLDELQREISR